jgi:guanylate kinase
MNRTNLIVISGPSGCGKTTIARALLRRHAEMHFSVSATTRARRANEIDGHDYHFITREEFQAKIRRDELAEWEQIYDDFYGTPLSEIAATGGGAVLFDIDVKGALSIKRKYPAQSLLIFVRPPSLEVLAERLRNRKTESAEALKKRLERATMELELAKEFDHTVTNDVLEEAIARADAIVRAALGERTGPAATGTQSIHKH